MPTLIDLTGQRFGKLVVLYRVENTIHNEVQWLCQCDCGNTTIVTSGHLRSGGTKSCGCSWYRKPKYDGEGSYDSLYPTWRGMINRCNNPNSSGYMNYGGRGITVCDDWLDFNNFKHWADETKTDQTLTLDRLNNDLGYSPDNCHWATAKEQNSNKRNNLLFELNGEICTLKEWCRRFNVNYLTIYSRIYREGWDFETAILTPVRTYN